MLLCRARSARPAIVYLLFTVALVMMPKADNPETLFDEANTPTNEMVIEKAVSPREYGQSDTAFEPKTFSQSLRITVRRSLPVYARQSTDCRGLRELFCSLLC